jgi:glycosyltransferase involved in cell wall biosynthesis
MMRTMLAQGHEVFALAPDFNEASRVELNSWGVQTIDTSVSRTGMNPFADLVYMFRLARTLRKLRPDCILSYLAKPVVFGSLAAWMAGVARRSVMISGIGSVLLLEPGERTITHHIMRMLYRLAIPRNHVVFFQNADDMALFRKWGFLRKRQQIVALAGSGVDLGHFAYHPIPEERPIRFLMVGRLIGDKGVREYVRAAAQMKEFHTKARVQLLGGLDSNPTGIDQTELDRWVAAGWIEYLGQVADVRVAIAQAHVVVLPSYREGTPRSLLEAMAMGRPIITTDVPGCREVIKDGLNGLLIPAKDPEALCKAMAQLSQADPGVLVKMGEEGRRFAEAQFDVRKVNNLILGALVTP